MFGEAAPGNPLVRGQGGRDSQPNGPTQLSRSMGVADPTTCPCINAVESRPLYRAGHGIDPNWTDAPWPYQHQ